MEFALLLPVFIVLTGGVINFAWYIQQRELVVEAVREGVRVGATTALTADPAGAAIKRSLEVLTGLGFTADASDFESSYDNLRSGTACNTDDTLTLDASVPFAAPLNLVPMPAAIHVRMTMMLEGADETCP